MPTLSIPTQSITHPAALRIPPAKAGSCASTPNYPTALRITPAKAGSCASIPTQSITHPTAFRITLVEV